MEQLWTESGSHVRERSRIVAHWAESLEAACDVLLASPPEVMTSTVVTGTLTGDPEEGRLLRSFSRQLAEARGLREVVSLGTSGFTVRFSRVTVLQR